MWDAFQREVLGAMGHTLLVPVAASMVELAASPAPQVVAADVEVRPALLRALTLAAGIDTHAGIERRDLGQYIVLPPLAELRTPIAKRGLWPRLRALRKTPPA
jgi:hypothetical protein